MPNALVDSLYQSVVDRIDEFTEPGWDQDLKETGDLGSRWYTRHKNTGSLTIQATRYDLDMPEVVKLVGVDIDRTPSGGGKVSYGACYPPPASLSQDGPVFEVHIFTDTGVQRRAMRPGELEEMLRLITTLEF